MASRPSAGRIFRNLDKKTRFKPASVWDDDDSYMIGIRQSTETLERVLQADRERGPGPVRDGAWDTEALRTEIRARSQEARLDEQAAARSDG